MACAAGPDIQENGLILAVDAGNFKSYSGIGTTVSSLVSNDNGILVNDPTYSSLNGGSFSFDGTNDYVDLGSNYFISTLSPFTVNTWVSINPRTPNGTQSDFHRIITLRSVGTSTFGIAYVSQLNSGYEGLYVANNNGWVRAKTSFYPSSNIFGFLTLTYNGSGSTNISNFKMYWNTTELTFNTSGLSTPAVTTDNNYLGARQPGDIQSFKGNIASIQIYNKLLNESEIRQNYNATKSRYGL